ncbi:MAG: putative ABC exporter domain-containing protein [Verrucomicrobiota bacterium]
MKGALVYLQLCLLWNRQRVWFRRLRKPKYLLGTLAGGAYCFFFFLGPMLGMGIRGNRIPVTPLVADFRPLVEMLGAVLLAGVVLLVWLVPSRRVALDFSEAEIAFLFPAPLERRTLIHYRILRSQIPIFFSSLLMMVFTGRFASTGHWWWHWVGWWLLVTALELHRLGAAFTTTRLLDSGLTTTRRRLAVLGTAVVLAGLFAGWVSLSVPVPTLDMLGHFTSVRDYLQQVAASGPAVWLLLPFRLLVRPMLAADGVAFTLALLPALALVAALYAWVVRSDASFEEASIELAHRKVKMLAAIRSGNWHLARGRQKQIRAPFRLGARGPRAVALLWKNLIAAGAIFTPRLWLGAGGALVVMAVVFTTMMPGALAPKIMGGMLMGLTPMLLVMGPQMMVMDLRQDLAVVDVLKTLPLPGRQVVLGEVLAPLTILTVAQWLLIALAVVLFNPENANVSSVPLALRLAVGLAAAMVAPGANLVSLLLINGAVLLFPAWVKTAGLGRSQGFEAIGQQMVMMVGQLLALAVALLIPAGLFALVYFAGRSWLPLLVVLPLAALAALAALLAESYAGLLMLGDLFERMDVSDEPAA